MGSVASCVKKDSELPAQPRLAKLAHRQAKQGKSLSEILAALDEAEAGSGGGGARGAPPPPAGSKKVAVHATIHAPGPRWPR